MMRNLLLLMILWGIAGNTLAQDFSNKGKEFWLGYGNHQQMYGGSASTQPGMDIYITSDVNTSVVVEIPGLGISNTYNVIANQITPINISNTAFLDQEGITNKGIHVVSQKPVVVYAHIYYASVSGATLCLPVNTLGRQYYSVNYTQAAQSNVNSNSYSYFFVVATENSTTIEVTPVANTQNMTAGQTYTYNLNKGQVYTALSNTDLTGSVIKSVSNGTGCKRIAVFCGSGRIGIGCSRNQISSSDNLYQQMYPTATWGKKYLTVPSATRPQNYYRIIRPDAATTVLLDGNPVNSANFINNFYYEFSDSDPHVIEADKPILIAQYYTTQDCGEPTGNGDPEMIYLNPVEQTISQVTLTSMRLINTSSNIHFINAIVKNSPGAINTFKIDGVLRSASFKPHPADPAYAYASIQVNIGTHTIICDTPFNAIAYGFGGAESYGYSAGTNLKDLYQFVGIENQYASVNFPAGCKNSPFKFSMTFPYQPIEIKWRFGAALNALGFRDTTIANPVVDSSWSVDGRTLYKYRLNLSYTIAATGIYPITVLANNPTSDGCNGEQEINYDLQIYDNPVAGFNYTHTGCFPDSVAFTDNSNPLTRTLTKWYWDFGDGNTSTLANPKHKYTGAGAYTVRHFAITDIGCLSDTLPKVLPVSDPPAATFALTGAICEKTAITFTDQSTFTGTGTITKWNWVFGDGSMRNLTNNNPFTYTYGAATSYPASLQVETSTGCKSTPFNKTVEVHPNPLVDFDLPGAVCLPAGATFTDQSTIADGTQAQFTYTWTFGDGGTANQQNPYHTYLSVGPSPFAVKLSVQSNNGCIHDTTKLFRTLYAQPKADAGVIAEACLGAASQFTDKSDGKGSAVTAWRWDFAGAQQAYQKDTTYTFATADTFKVRHWVVTDKGCQSDTITRDAIVTPLPVANYTVRTPTCAGATIYFDDASTTRTGTITNWDWNLDGATVQQQNAVRIYNEPGTYSIKLTVKNSKGCTSTTVVRPLTVNYVPVAGFKLPDVCLSDGMAVFTDTSSIGDHSEAQFSYNWNFGDGGADAQKNGQHAYAAVGTYPVALTVTSKDGCTHTSTQSFTVNGEVRKAAFGVLDVTNLCSNKIVTLNDASEVTSGRLVRLEIYWDYTNDPTIKTEQTYPVAGGAYTHQYPDFGTPATKDHQVRLYAYSGTNCFKEALQTITIKASPSVNFGVLSPVCEEVAPFNITAASEVYGFTGTGTYSGAGITSAGLFNPAAAKAGTKTIRYTFDAGNGCSAYGEQTIKVLPTPIADAGPDRGVLEGGFTQLQARASGNNISIQWSPVAGTDNPAIATPRVSPSTDVLYTLTVVSADQCMAKDDVWVRVLKQPVIPNAFSPNNDGINDTWVIQYLDTYPGCTVEVYNRYGQKVFSSVGYGKPWDGKVNGNPLPVGTYYWIINPKNGRAAVNGSVTIIR